ncbi:MAG: hypothetical protein KKA31_02360 [Candidatus Margulisbacteria bacterium]|nr:hypothetical protein [Candidatus Margulisiibacteriota bacterium]
MCDEQIKEFRNKVYEEYKPLFDLHQELFELYGETADKCNEKKMPIEEISSLQNVIGFLSTKAFKTYVSIYLLCLNGAGQDAEILLRSLIEILINIKYLLKTDSDTRSNMYFDFFDFKTARDIEKLKNDPRIGKRLKEHEERYNERKEKYLEKYDIKNKISWSGVFLSDMAKNADLTEIYNKAYNFSSNMVHSNILCSPEYIKTVEGHIDFDAGPSFSCVERVLTSSLECLINILLDFNKVFEVDNDQKINNFITRYKKIVNKFKERINTDPNL